MTITGMINEKNLLIGNATQQNVYDFLLLTIQEQLSPGFERENDLAFYHETFRVYSDFPLRDGVVIKINLWIEPKRPERPVQTYPGLDFMVFKIVQIANDRMLLYGGCSNHEQGKQEFEKLWQIITDTYSQQLGRSNSKNSFGVETKQEETVAEALRRYSRALATGQVLPDINSGLWQEMKALFDLGGGDLAKGVEIWSNRRLQEHEKLKKDNPVYALAANMLESENPVHRALLRIFSDPSDPASNMSLEEFLERAGKALAEEQAESAKRLPILPDQQRPTAIAVAKPKKLKQKRGAQLKTAFSLQRLRDIRLDAINSNRSIPTKVAAMNEAGITDKTWKKYDLELWARWDDKSYKQEKQE